MIARIMRATRRIPFKALVAVYVVLVGLSAILGLAALFSGTREWAFEHAPLFLTDIKSCRDFGTPFFLLGTSMAVAGGQAGALASGRVELLKRGWLLFPGAAAQGVWILAWTASRPCGL